MLSQMAKEIYFLLLSKRFMLPKCKRMLHEKNYLKKTVSVWQGYRKCLSKSKVAFLKTHKCASSTIQNMLMRQSQL
jgi:uncharacterized membrane protein YbaN (DUF454 family)